MNIIQTHEQANAVNASLTGKSFTIQAFAGAGKTSTAEFIAKTLGRRGVYLAFNKETANSAHQKLVRYGCEARTTHSLAWRDVASKMPNNTKKLSAGVNSYIIKRFLNIKDLSLGDVTFSSDELSLIVQRTYKKFLNTTSHQVAFEHLPLWGTKVFQLDKRYRDRLESFAISRSNRLWAAAIDPNDSRFPLSHSGYLKLWSLTGASNLSGYGYIILDEAQDTNSCVAWALNQHPHIQQLYIGDRYQQIYRWRGATNAMDTFKSNHQCYLSKSFRFGSSIARYATAIIQRLGSKVAIEGNSDIKDEVKFLAMEKTPDSTIRPDAVLCRTNLGTFGKYVELCANGIMAHILEGSQDVQGILDDVVNLKLDIPAASSFLMGFQSWGHLERYVKNNSNDLSPELFGLVRIVEQYGIEDLVSMFDRMPARSRGNVVDITTVHKIKGDEWNNVVELHTDFLSLSPNRVGNLFSTFTDTEEELMIYYVAVTRAKNKLILPADYIKSF